MIYDILNCQRLFLPIFRIFLSGVGAGGHTNLGNFYPTTIYLGGKYNLRKLYPK